MIIESQQVRLESPVTDRDHLLGPPNARVTVVTYGDYECLACQGRHRATEKMFDKMRGQVRFVYRHLPLLRVHPRALRAAEAAEAAAAQGRFWQMHRLLYSHPNKLRDLELRRYARSIGLDLVRFDRDMKSGVYADQIKKNCYESIINGISGAPTTFVNGELFAKSGVELLTAVMSMAGESIPVFSHRM